MRFIQEMDNSILFFFQDLHFPLLDKIMVFITNLGNIGFIWFVVAAILLSTKKYRKYGFILCISIFASAFVGNLVLKPFFERPRPCSAFPEIPLLIKTPDAFSFPSGHATSSFAAATILFFSNKKLGIAGFVLAALISLSRVYLFVHYPTDVFFGALLGIAVAIGTFYSYKVISKNKSVQ